MSSWWELEVTGVHGTDKYFFDEEPEFSIPEVYKGRVVGYDGTCGGDFREVCIVIDNCVSWTLDKVEREEGH